MKPASDQFASNLGGCCIGIASMLCIQAEYLRASDIRFTEVTEEAGITFALDVPEDTWFNYAHFFGGIGLADFDKNGAIDIYFTGGGGDHDTLYLNDGTGHFTDASEEWGLDIIDLSCGVGAGDLDNDGWIDIVVASAGDASIQGGSPGNYRLYRNINGQRFEEIAESAGVNNVAPGSKQHPTFATPGDFNADGHLDLIYGAWHIEAQGNRFYLNNGDGTFTDVTRSMGFHHEVHLGQGFSASVTDMDGDLFPDITWVSDFNKSRYFRNNGDGTFTNLCPGNGTGVDETAMGSSIFDFNLDGRLDWFVGAIWYHDDDSDYNGNAFYVQIADHQYVNLAVPFDLLDSGWAWSTVAADLDQDGLEDLVVGNGVRYPDFVDESEYIFKQYNQNGTFYNITSETGLDLACQATSTASFDMEGDGDLDLVFICNKGLAHIYRNDSINQGSWLQVSLGGDPDNRIPNHGFNTRVEARIGSTTRTRYMDGRPSYGASGPQTLHFGLGSATMIDQLTVRWINGEVTVLSNVAVNQFLHIDPPGKVPVGDMNGDTFVDGYDLTQLLCVWGTCPTPPAECHADFDGDGLVNGLDLAVLLENWTTRP
jgi:hypothetical protein